jgi:predicted nucleic acid-binding protein
MIVIDTSVWVSALRSTRSAESPVLSALLDADEVLLAAPVRTELLSGAGANQREALRSALTPLPIAYPTVETWRLIDSWTARALDRGERFGMGDLLIAAIAHEAGGLVWSLDGDFGRLARLQLIQLYEP